MSTKAIKAVLEWAGRGDGPPELADALAELVAIRDVVRDMRMHVGIHESGPNEDISGHVDGWADAIDAEVA